MLSELLHANAANLGGHVAVEYGDQHLTFEELLERTEKLAGGLSSLGVGRGDVVMVLLPNVPDYLTSFLAVTTLGAGVLVLDPGSKEYELRLAFADCRPRAVITDQKGMGRCHAVAADLGVITTLVAVDASPSGAVPIDTLLGSGSTAPRNDDLSEMAALYQYSSGSTGRQKRVGRTQAQCAGEARLVAESLGLTPDDRILCTIPLFHAYGFGDCMLAAFGSGATLVIQPHPQPFAVKRAQTLELIESRRATILPIVPYMADLLVGTPGSRDVSSLRYCFSAGTALAPEIASAFADRFGVPIRQLYGCTEAPSISCNLDPDPAASAASVGHPMKDVEVAIEPSDEPDLPLGVGEVGVKSPAAASGYFGDARGDRQTFRGGWVYPGDLGSLDADGRLTLVGRTKIFIDVHGHKVDPFEVEDVLALHPAVRQVVVVGTAEPSSGGQAVKAAVVSGEPISERELIRYAQERLANYKVPQLVEFRDEIPRSQTGKVLRHYLL